MRSRDELRENFFRLFRRSYLLAERSQPGSGLAVYRSAADIVHRLCGEPWAQSTIFPAEAALVRRFLDEAQLSAGNPDSVVQLSLMANPWVATWMEIMHQLEREAFDALCPVSGAEHLRAAQAAGRGIVLLHSHTVFVQLFWAWLRHSGIAPGVTIWQWAWRRSPGERRDPRIHAVEGARELHSASAVLRQGGMVHVLGDGHRGGEKVVIPFCGRMRGFAPTFAGLALNAKASILPVVVSFGSDGRVSIEIRPPLSEGASGRDQNERIELLVGRYAEHLREQWRAHPADVPWFQMKRHLDLPPP